MHACIHASVSALATPLELFSTDKTVPTSYRIPVTCSCSKYSLINTNIRRTARCVITWWWILRRVQHHLSAIPFRGVRRSGPCTSIWPWPWSSAASSRTPTYFTLTVSGAQTQNRQEKTHVRERLAVWDRDTTPQPRLLITVKYSFNKACQVWRAHMPIDGPS